MQEVNVEGVAEIVTVASPLARFEAHVHQAALEALIDARAPAVVLAGHTLDRGRPIVLRRLIVRRRCTESCGQQGDPLGRVAAGGQRSLGTAR